MESQLRGPELALLDELFADVRRGVGRAAYVTGSPGTGKSALLDRAARRARELGLPVLSAAASPAEAELPLGVVGQLLSHTGREATNAAAVDTLYEALRDTDGPVVVVVDDVEHTDEPSARCLLYLCGRFAASGILLLMAGRPQPRSAPPAPLAALLGHARCTAVELRTLDEDGVTAFLGAPTGAGLDTLAARRLAPAWHRATGGNLRLLLALLDDHRACEPVRPSGPVAGSAYKQAVIACLRPAGSAAWTAARALAVLGDAATLTLLARLLGVHERAAARTLEALDATGLLLGGRLRHEGMRAAVLEELPAAECGRLHTEAARLLSESGGEPRAVARHLVAAQAMGGMEPAPAWAVPQLVEAGSRALRDREPRQAAEFLRTAHRASGDAEQRAALLEMLARTAWEADPAAAVQYLPPLEGELAAGRLETGRAVGALGLLLWHGRITEATRAVTGVGHLGLRDQALPAAARELWSRLGHICPETLAALPGPTGVRAPQEAEGEAERVLQTLAHDHASPPPSVAGVLSALLHAGETERAAQWSALLADADPTGATVARRAVLAAAAAVVEARTGAYERASQQAHQALELLGPGAWGVAIGMPLSAAVLAATRRGRYEEAARQLRIPVPDAMFRTRAGPHYLLARGHFQLAVGRPRAALGDFHACRDLTAPWQPAPGGTVLDWRTPAAAAAQALRGGAQRDGDPIAALTRAEQRVAVLAAHGCTNRGIAARLYVTPSTVEQHLTRIYRKLSLKSRSDLAELIAA